MSLHAIFATDSKGGFGKGNSLPWPRQQKDMDFFRHTTTNHVILMGKSTYMSLPNPLPNRINVVLSSTLEDTDRAYVLPDSSYIPALVRMYGEDERDVYLIGGLSLLSRKNFEMCTSVFHSEIHSENDADLFFPKETLDWLKTHPSTIIEQGKDLTITEYHIHEKLS